MKEERREQVARPVDRDRQIGRAEAPKTRVIAGQHVQAVGGSVSELERLRHDDPRSALA